MNPFCPVSGMFIQLPCYSTGCRHAPLYMAFEYVADLLRAGRSLHCRQCRASLSLEELRVDARAGEFLKALKDKYLPSDQLARFLTRPRPG